MKIALVGNPNVGKTTLFNKLTGLNQKIGNWPGVTVDKKIGYLKGDKKVEVVDLPGIYSLTPYSPEEIVARDVLLSDDVDLIVNIVDGTNLSRNLYLTLQLLELNKPMIFVLNMADLMKKQNIVIDADKMAELLGCDVIYASVNDDAKLVATIKQEIHNDKPKFMMFNSELEKMIVEVMDKYQLNRFKAIKLLENDTRVQDEVNNHHMYSEDEEIAKERYDYIDKLIEETNYQKLPRSKSLTSKIDRIVTNKFLGFPIFFLIMFLIYYVSVTWLGSMVTDWTNDVFFGEWVIGFFNNLFDQLGVVSWLHKLIVDGIISGVGAVLGFVPQLLILFAFLSILEESGYMARVAYILDSLFSRFGLNGKIFIPMLIGSGCGVPAVMSTKTIENEFERRVAISTTTFIPCSAKLPLIALIAGALFNGASWVAPTAYFIGIASILISGIIMQKFNFLPKEESMFVMELPDYHMPRLTYVLRSVWEKGSSFVKKAGTIILLSTIILWFLSNYRLSGFMIKETSNMNHSLLANIGSLLAWIFKPLGFGTWQASVATITGLIAKENVVGTLGVVYGFAQVSENGQEIWRLLAQDFTTISAFAFLVFNLLCAPCFAAIGTIKKEMASKKWSIFAIAYQCIYAYLFAFVIYQIGTFITTGSFGIGVILAIIVLVYFIYLLCFKKVKEKKQNG